MEMSVSRPVLRLIKVRGLPILDQLQLEVSLYRNSRENWCILNDGTPAPTIVLGKSGDVTELLNLEEVIRDKVPVVRRESGGGTVVVDNNSVFVSFVCNQERFLTVNPSGVTAWSKQLYGGVFQGVQGFDIRDSDHVVGDRKLGGSAQMMSLWKRFLLHTSFLWDYDTRRMDYLTIPRRAPAYRLGRSHGEFVCRLGEFFPSRQVFLNTLENGLHSFFTLEPSSIADVYQVESYSPTAREELLHA